MRASPLLESIHGRWIVLFGIHMSAMHFVLEVVHQGLSGWSCVDWDTFSIGLSESRNNIIFDSPSNSMRIGNCGWR